MKLTLLYVTMKARECNLKELTRTLCPGTVAEVSSAVTSAPSGLSATLSGSFPPLSVNDTIAWRHPSATGASNSRLPKNRNNLFNDWLVGAAFTSTRKLGKPNVATTSFKTRRAPRLFSNLAFALSICLRRAAFGAMMAHLRKELGKN